MFPTLAFLGGTCSFKFEGAQHRRTRDAVCGVELSYYVHKWNFIHLNIYNNINSVCVRLESFFFVVAPLDLGRRGRFETESESPPK